VTEITVSGVTDFRALGHRWRVLETRADGSFFQSWTWVGCLAEERFPDPVLVEARSAGRTVALALFNRTRTVWARAVLHLAESGNEAIDNLTVEHNGVLTERGQDPDLAAACLAAVRRHRSGRVWSSQPRLIAAGVDENTIALLRRAVGHVSIVREMPAPFVDLARRRVASADGMADLSANTRQQLRRSNRLYAAHGSITVERAETADQARAFLDEMAALHQARWRSRGKPGAFADPFFGRFHQALVERGTSRGEVDLLRIRAGTGTIGVLYNFRYRGTVLAYQGGFNYPPGPSRLKPGLTCHDQAIRQYAAAGLSRYDFLAGEARYKRSLADGETTLYWAEAGAPMRALTARIKRAVVWSLNRMRPCKTPVSAAQRPAGQAPHRQVAHASWRVSYE